MTRIRSMVRVWNSALVALPVWGCATEDQHPGGGDGPLADGVSADTACVLAPVQSTALDTACMEANIAAAVAKYGVSGKGVLIAILDRGLDYTNHDFRNPDGTTRVEAILDLTDDGGAASSGDGQGTLYTRAQINAALSSGSALATRDAVGHGTATTGNACGNGRNSPGGKYHGVAPNATLLIVKVVSDGAPAHDDQPAESAFYVAARVITAIQFVKDEKTALGLPCVMLLNIGSQGGPTDGTSRMARKIDEVVGPGKPGIVFVTGTGDDGGIANRAGGDVAPGSSAVIQIQKAATGVLTFDLWYPEADRFSVSITTPTSTTSTFPAPASARLSDSASTSEFKYFHQGADVDFYGATNDKREIFIQLIGAPGTYAVTLTGTSITAGGHFDATINPSQFVNPAVSGNRFLTFVAPGSVWDASAAVNNISPNAYVGRTTWTDIDHVVRSSDLAQGLPGEIWKGSSIGPTFDGRLGVDVSAPGHQVITSYGTKTYWATFRFNLVDDGGGLYGMAGAVSAAAPMVTGVIALMLEMNPTLDAAEIRNLLRRSARADVHTGPVPNTTWGYGKLDALAALDATRNAARAR